MYFYSGLRGVSGIPNNTKATLLQQLTSKIRFTGPITVADYMKEVLTNSLTVCFSTVMQNIKFFVKLYFHSLWLKFAVFAKCELFCDFVGLLHA